MVLQYLHIPFDYSALLKLLETRYFGTAFSNVRKLETLGLFVNSSEWGDLELLAIILNAGLPLLVNVNTKELTSYWKDESSHVVLGISDMP